MVCCSLQCGDWLQDSHFVVDVLQAKQALKEAPKDDEALDRQEEGEIDKGFIESSSSSEDELTEEGKTL